MNQILTTIFLMGFFLAAQAMERAYRMEDEINFRFQDTGISLGVPHNWEGLKKVDAPPAFFWRSTEINMKKYPNLEEHIMVESDKIKGDMSDCYDISAYNRQLWNVYPLLLCSDGQYYEVSSWKMIVTKLQHESNGSYFSLLFLLKENDRTLLPLTMGYYVLVGINHWHKDHDVFAYKITRIETYQTQKYECC